MVETKDAPVKSQPQLNLSFSTQPLSPSLTPSIKHKIYYQQKKFQEHNQLLLISYGKRLSLSPKKNDLGNKIFVNQFGSSILKFQMVKEFLGISNRSGFRKNPIV